MTRTATAVLSSKMRAETSSFLIKRCRGMGGIGKTVLAQALCRDPAIERAFPDRIFWITVGREKRAFSDRIASVTRAGPNAGPIHRRRRQQRAARPRSPSRERLFGQGQEPGGD